MEVRVGVEVRARATLPQLEDGRAEHRGDADDEAGRVELHIGHGGEAEPEEEDRERELDLGRGRHAEEQRLVRVKVRFRVRARG